MDNPPFFIHQFFRQFWLILRMDFRLRRNPSLVGKQPLLHNTNGILGELLRKKMISFTCEKFTVAMGTYFFRAFRSIKIFKWNGLELHWCYIINRKLHGRLEIRNFSSRVEKKIFHERAAFTGHAMWQPCGTVMLSWTLCLFRIYTSIFLSSGTQTVSTNLTSILLTPKKLLTWRTSSQAMKFWKMEFQPHLHWEPSPPRTRLRKSFFDEDYSTFLMGLKVLTRWWYRSSLAAMFTLSRAQIQSKCKILGPGKIQRKITQLRPWLANMQIRASRLLIWIFALWSLANTVFLYNIPSKIMTLTYLLYQRLGLTRRLIIKPCRFLDLYSSAKIGENVKLVAALPCTSETHSKRHF